MRRLIISAFLLFLVWTGGTLAQDCNAVLHDGVFASTNWQSDSNAALVFVAELTKMNDRDVETNLGHSGEVGIGPLKIGPGTWNSDKREQVLDYIHTFTSVDSILGNKASLLSTVGDSAVLSAWSDCVATNGGLTMRLAGAGPDNALATVRWVPFPTAGAVDPKVTAVTVSNGKVLDDGGVVRVGRRLGQRVDRIVTLGRDPTKTLIFVVDTNVGGSVSAMLLPDPVPSPPEPSQKLCKIIHGGNDNEPRNKVVLMDPSAKVADCAALARDAGASDAKLGCRSKGADLLADQRFAVTIGQGYDPNLSAAGPPFGPPPDLNCGW